jgi:putative hemolysin
MGLANPASVYCQGLGFTEETAENELGQYGQCIFPDGEVCDTWDFLAGRCGQEHSYCVQQGFELAATEDSNIGTCVFDDGSTCSELLYFQGDCKPGENIP